MESSESVRITFPPFLFFVSFPIQNLPPGFMKPRFCRKINKLKNPGFYKKLKNLGFFTKVFLLKTTVRKTVRNCSVELILQTDIYIVAISGSSIM